MSKFITLDLAGRSAWASFDGGGVLDYGVFPQMKTPFSKLYPMGKDHPWDLLNIVEELVIPIIKKILSEDFKLVIIEQTNKGRNRSQQKFLEWIHFELIKLINKYNKEVCKSEIIKVIYLDTMEWRSLLGIKIDKDVKEYNKALKKTKTPGKISIKHVTIYYINELLSIELKAKQDDEADAISLGLAYLKILNIGVDKYYNNKDIKKIDTLEKRKTKLANKKLKKEYDKLLKSGMLFKYYSGLTGNYRKDKIIWEKLQKSLDKS